MKSSSSQIPTQFKEQLEPLLNKLSSAYGNVDEFLARMIHRGNSRNPNFGKAISLLALVGLFYFASQAVGPTKKFMGYCMTVKK